MKMRYVLAALLMSGTAAHAGNSISFEINGHHVRIEAPKNCNELSCIQISAPGVSASDFGFKSFKTGRDDDDNVAVRNDPPAPKYAPAPITQAAAPALAPAASAPPAPATTLASTAPDSTSNDNIAPATPATAGGAPPAAVAATPAPAATTPLGVWATEENKGDVRVEQCGQNLCGYAVKTGERILIDMKPSNAKWTGQIHDPDSGRDYDSTIVMKGPNSLKVQGCAFGGLFCGGQTWSRVS